MRFTGIRGVINMRMAIVDDVLAEQEIIKKYIIEWASIHNEMIEFRCFENSESFLFSWEDDKSYDLLVLDIEMGEMNGLELAKRMRTEGALIPILFVTGYDEYMQYGYDVDALHYLLKPVNKDKLFLTLNKIGTSSQEKKNCLILSTKDEVKRIVVNDLMYVEANGHGSTIHMKDCVFEARESFGTIEKSILGDGHLLKCHRAFIVNLHYCAAIKNGSMILDNNEMIPISRNHVKDVQTQLIKYYRG